MSNPPLTLTCDSCGVCLELGRDAWAMDRYGVPLCHDCHVQAVLILKLAGVTWRGVTFGYTLDDAEEF
jgi:hypothetical protein